MRSGSVLLFAICFFFLLLFFLLSFFSEFLLANLTVWLTSCGTMCDFLYLTLNTAHGRIDHHQRRRRRHCCYCCFDHSLDRHHSFIACARARARPLAHVNVCKTFRIEDEITSHKWKKERKKYKTHSPILLRTSFGTFVVFCPGLPVCVCDCVVKLNAIILWWRYDDDYTIANIYSFIGISHRFRFVRLCSRSLASHNVFV